MITTAMIFLTIITLGLSCGLGCGSVSTPFILGKLLGEGKNQKESMIAISVFSLGKIIALALLGFLSSMAGTIIMNNLTSAYGNYIVWLIRGLTLLFGLLIIFSALKPKKCNFCKNNFFEASSYFVSGILYGIIPCTPLITALTHASTMKPLLGLLLLLTFGIANSLIPVLLYSPIIGFINTKIIQDLPQFTKGVKIFGGLLLIALVFFI